MKHFTIDEFKCTHCGTEEMKEDFLIMLDRAREEAGVPFKITSGYRCDEHNKAIGGATHSAHTTGYACDIACANSEHRFKIITALLGRGFNRIGVSKQFIHVDCDPSLPCKVIWTY